MIAYFVAGPVLVFAEVVLVARARWGADDGGVFRGGPVAGGGLGV
jgi:hypothetical protein